MIALQAKRYGRLMTLVVVAPFNANKQTEARKEQRSAVLQAPTPLTLQAVYFLTLQAVYFNASCTL